LILLEGNSRIKTFCPAHTQYGLKGCFLTFLR
jgi:hypothetical protein